MIRSTQNQVNLVLVVSCTVGSTQFAALPCYMVVLVTSNVFIWKSGIRAMSFSFHATYQTTAGRISTPSWNCSISSTAQCALLNRHSQCL